MAHRTWIVAVALLLGITAVAVPGLTAAADAPAPAQKSATMAAEKAPVNVNTATVKELTKLEGVGDKLAKAIVEYRDKNGPFKAPEDLKKVKGIGDKKFAAMKANVTVK